MSKKGLNIHKRSDGRWEGRYRIGFYRSGSIKYASVYGKTYTEAKDRLLAAIAANAEPDQRGAEKTFSEILHLWLSNNRLKQKGSTEHKYRTIIERHIEPELGAVKLSRMTSVTVNTFLTRKLEAGRLDGKGGLSPSYVRTMAQIIQSAMQFATEEGYCSPLRTAVYKPAPKKKEFQILSREEQADLERYISIHCDSAAIGVLITLYTGLRIGEVCALAWEDVDLDHGIIHIRHTISRVRDRNSDSQASTKLILSSPKTASSVRDVPIMSVLIPYLTGLKQKCSTGFLISDTDGYISPRTYEYRFHRLLDHCGIPQVNYHALRHTFATRCVEAGMDVKSLSEILGHANVGITLNTYVHSSMERKRQQLEQLERSRA